jgi:hypothetical protein
MVAKKHQHGLRMHSPDSDCERRSILISPDVSPRSANLSVLLGSGRGDTCANGISPG